ncbi:MAG TPA: hypothetical protein VIB78_08760 [Acidimicrobiia bacterium]
MKAELATWDLLVDDTAAMLLSGRVVRRWGVDVGERLAAFRDDLEYLIADASRELSRLDEYLGYLGLITRLWSRVEPFLGRGSMPARELEALRVARESWAEVYPWHVDRSERVQEVKAGLVKWSSAVGSPADHLLNGEAVEQPEVDVAAGLAAFRRSVEDLQEEIGGELERLGDYRRYLESLEKVWAEVDPLLSPALEDDQMEETPAGP